MTMNRSAIDMRVVAHALRAAGQAGAVATLIRDDAPFDDIVQQLLATRGSFDSLLIRLVERELQIHGGSRPDAEEVVSRVLRIAFDRSHRGSGHALSARATRTGTE